MRLFIAVSFDNEVQKALTDIQNDMRRQGVRGNYSPEENLHLTLCFIGEYNDPAKVMSVMSSVPFPGGVVTVNGVGAFSDLLWAGIKCPNGLFTYVKELKSAFYKAGVPYDGKKFSPHVTLVRRADKNPERTTGGVSASCMIKKVSLFKSERGGSKMIYTELGSVAITAADDAGGAL